MGRKVKDVTGQKFGKLTALYRLHNYHKANTYWLCVCECGNLTEVTLSRLRTGNTKSCGCLHGERHGDSFTRLNRIYRGIKTRCYNTKNKEYKYYGGRGIAVCEEWKNSYLAFKSWAMNNGYDDTLTIDRINVNGDYIPENCHWITNKEQQRNKNNNLLYTIDNNIKTLPEWCDIYNINYKKAYNRLNQLHWTIEQALELEGE